MKFVESFSLLFIIFDKEIIGVENMQEIVALYICIQNAFRRRKIMRNSAEARKKKKRKSINHENQISHQE